MRTLFVAIATGQNVANLPPIIELGKPDDRVLWGISPYAREQGWADGASEVLRERGLRILQHADIDDIGDPRSVKQGLIRRLSAERSAVDRMIFVANGGPKLALLGLNAVMNIFSNEVDCVLYGQDRPAELWQLDKEQWQISPKQYTTALTLEEILTCSGREIRNPSTARKFWTNADGTISHPENAMYPAVPREIAEFHQQHHEIARRSRYEFFAPHWDELEAVFGKPSVDAWSHTAQRFLEADTFPSGRRIYNATRELIGATRLSPPWDEAWQAGFADKYRADFDAIKSRPEQAEQRIADCIPKLYQNVRRFIEEKTLEHVRKLLMPGPKPARLGPAFESAVEKRVADWLGKNRGVNAVTEAWVNVEVRRKDFNTHDGEFDILFVLKNGILIHLEAKSFQASQKDLDARLLNLHLSGSNLARMAVVGPIYTQFAGDEWMKQVLAFRERTKNLGKTPFIPFTLPGQKRILSTPSGEEELPPFEESLSKLIRPYNS